MRLLCPLMLLCAGVSFGAEEAGFAFRPLDDFEDISGWNKGDPNTDLAQKDAVVTTDSEFVKQGKQSIAFMIRVNWKKRPEEKYAKGWPMMRRAFNTPQDWSEYDYVDFWLYAKTDLSLVQMLVLRVGFPWEGMKVRLPWHTIEGIKPNQWQRVRVPLTVEADWERITGISFYVAEQWYKDGDKVDFYIDDMRLVRRTVPAISSCSVTARTFPRGRTLGVRLKTEGPVEGCRVRCQVDGSSLASPRPMDSKEADLAFPIQGLPAGGHRAVVELLDPSGKVVDSRAQYFRSLQSGKRCYLKLITFYTKPIGVMTPEVIGVLNDSAYAGVAIPLLGSYDTDPVPPYESFREKGDKLRRVLKIDPWPWVVSNRFIGAPSGDKTHAHTHAKDVNYFLRVKALDLDNGAGNRADMMKLWRYAVRMAREWKSPGIMLDLEAYNHGRTYSTAWVAQQRGETIDETIAKCEKVGEDLAKIIQEEYPGCMVWSLFSRLEKTVRVPGRGAPILTTPGYITLGLLKYAKAHNVPLRYLCGGETTPGYCNKSVAALKRRIADRDRDVARFLEQFPDRFALAGTISPFHDYSIAKSFIQRGYAGSDFKTIEDFEPMFKTLFDAYDYLWIYASSAAKTLPYSSENSLRYSRVLRAALGRSAGGP